ncbi:YgeY family selenium metabolism-linked hydrolase [Oscillospiraceae bacterium HV4-5-C5C]|nr:YgeY family selenium metabolism-linked hydrolase [Oscillospiraceae bacterium HV4-5-C5C]
MSMQDKAIALCQAMVQCRSYSGQEEGVARILKQFFEQSGYDQAYLDEFGNAIGVINGSHPGPTLVFDGHMDTVPVPDPALWTQEPFGARIAGDRLYGRGTSDMKGGLAAAAAGAAAFAQATRRRFSGRIVVAGTVYEELCEGLASSYIWQAFRPDYVIIAEASELNLKIGQRGRAEIVLETTGTTAHSAHPEQGNNAVYSMCKAIQALTSLPLTRHPLLKESLLVLTDIKSEPYPGSSCVPAGCRATFDRRTLTGETRESILAPLQACLDELAARDPQVKATVSYARGHGCSYTGMTYEVEKYFPAWLFSPEDAFVSRSLAALDEAGLHADISAYEFCTNGSYYAGFKGVPTLGYGPSQEKLAHTVDEYIELSQLRQAVQGNQAILKALLS